MSTEAKQPLNPASGMATAGFICGISSIVLFWAFGLGQILAILSHVFSGIAYSRKERLGKAGLILGIISWVPVVLYFLFAVIFGLSVALGSM